VQKKRGEFSTDSKLLSRMIEHQEKRETHEQTMVDMRKKFELAREQQGGAKAEGAKAEGAKAGARGKGGSPETAGKKVRRRQPQQEEEEDSSSTTGEEDDDSEEEEEEETTEATLRRRNPAKPK
jgi:hypothetical protein